MPSGSSEPFSSAVVRVTLVAGSVLTSRTAAGRIFTAALRFTPLLVLTTTRAR